jgi:chaperonin GroES
MDQYNDGADGGESDNLSALFESTNIAEKLDKKKLAEIGDECQKGFESDFESCDDWQRDCEQWINLAKQVCEKKNYPWPGASNVKFPMLSTAAMQFAARAYPSLVPSDGAIVKAKPIGKDPQGQKTIVAEAVSLYMSYQLLYEMDGWEADMDRLLIMLPIVGTMFKKTYWDGVKKVNCSRLVLPTKLFVDYWTQTLEDAERISELLELSERKFKERVMSGVWLDVELGDPQTPQDAKNPPRNDSTTPYEFVEQHTYLDLDDDGYREPYIVTFHRNTGKVVRIVARFDEDTIYTDDEGELQKIEAIQYYTKFGFVPNPDGGFYDIGFGVLLGPLNESVNTLINQLVDAGHMSSLQSGFLGKGLRLRAGEQRFTPGEWKLVNNTGDDLKKQVVPLPASQPSTVLLELMGSLVTSGKELASVAEIFTGKMPGQNTPATTTMATVEQGMKVFTAVYKRVYRALTEEFKKLYRLNAIYINEQEYADVVEMPSASKDDFKVKTHSIYPGADPTSVSQSEKLLKAQGLVELAPMFPGMLNPVEIVNRVLEAQEQPNRQALFAQEVQQSGQWQPPPDPKVQELQMKTQADQAVSQQKIAASQQQAALDNQSKQAELQMKQEGHAADLHAKQQELQLEMASNMARDRAKALQESQQMAQDQQLHQQTLAHNEQQHQQGLVQGKEQSQAKVQQMKAQAKAKPTPKK